VTTAVIGLGNPLLTDDGVGLVLLEALRAEGWTDVDLVDGGTWGLSLLPTLADADRVLVLDAVRSGNAPGTIVRGANDDIPRLYRYPLSPHQIDLSEVLAAAELSGGLPEHVEVIGVEPASTDGPRVELSDAVAAALPRALDEARRVLDSWGIAATDHPPPVGAIPSDATS
jgi:hydrogenase maturation protease